MGSWERKKGQNMNNLNFDFGLKDYEATKLRHEKQIQKLKKIPRAYTSDTVWDKLMDSNWLEEIEYLVKTGWEGRGSLWYDYNILKADGRLHDFRKHQSQLREVKTVINEATRHYIRQTLEFYELPKSWDTAFYCLYYKRINAGMKRLAKFYI